VVETAWSPSLSVTVQSTQTCVTYHIKSILASLSNSSPKVGEYVDLTASIVYDTSIPVNPRNNQPQPNINQFLIKINNNTYNIYQCPLIDVKGVYTIGWSSNNTIQNIKVTLAFKQAGTYTISLGVEYETTTCVGYTPAYGYAEVAWSNPVTASPLGLEAGDYLAGFLTGALFMPAVAYGVEYLRKHPIKLGFRRR